MWSAVVVAIMVSVAGYYSMVSQQNVAATEATVASNSLANGMAIYRQAVLNYYIANPPSLPVSAALPIGTLKSAGMLPSWAINSDGQVNNILTYWSYYIDVNGIIYIYASSNLPTNILPQVISLSQNSALVGQITSQTDDPPSVFKPTGIALPVGSPIWLASLH